MKVPEAIRILSEEIRQEGCGREELLQAKCAWEHMTRSAVLMRYGDPGAWLDRDCKELDEMTLTKRDSEAFAKALIEPPAPNRSLSEAAMRETANSISTIGHKLQPGE